MTAASVMPSPAPPTLSGMAMPNQPASAMVLWNFDRKFPIGIALQPIIVAELGANFQHRLADIPLVFVQIEIHGCSPDCPAMHRA
jgi:hypothetical protein